MQAGPKFIEERSRYFSKRRCVSSHNIFNPNEITYDDAVPSGLSSSQPDLCGRSTEDDKTSSQASSTKGFKTSIPVRETNTSKLRKMFASTERLPKREQNTTKPGQDKPKWHVPSKVRYNVNGSMTSRVPVAKTKKSEQSDASDSNSMKSKSDIGCKDSKFNSKIKSEVKLDPHICHHGSYVEVKFPSLMDKKKFLKNESFENFDLKFVINASDLCDSVEKLKEQSKLISNNRNDLNSNYDNLHVFGDKQYSLMEESFPDECEDEKFQHWEKTKTNYVGPDTNENTYPFDNRLEFIPYRKSISTQANPGDCFQNSFGFTPSSQHQVNHSAREQHLEPEEFNRNTLGPPYQLNVFERYPSDDQMCVPSSESKLLQNGVTITSRIFTKHERATTELVTKIPQPIGFVPIRKSLPAKTRSAFTMKRTLDLEDSLSNIPQYQELGSKIPKRSLDVHMPLANIPPLEEKEDTQENDSNRREVSNLEDIPPFLKKSKFEIPQENRDFFTDYNLVSNPHPERSFGNQEVLPTEIPHSFDNQHQELKKQNNLDNSLNSKTFENHTEVPNDVPITKSSKVCSEKDVPKQISSQQRIVKSAVCRCLQKVKCVTFREGIVDNILNQLKEQANLDLDTLFFKSIFVIAFISVFLYYFY